MSSWVVGLVLASALAHASWNALLKGRAADPLAASAGLSLTWALIATPLAIGVGPPAPSAIPHLALSVLVHLSYFTLLVRAYRLGDLSFVYPVARGVPPLLVTIAAWLTLEERPSVPGAVGVVLIAAGVFAIGFGSRRPVVAVDPEVVPERTGDASSRPLALALLVAACIAVYTMLDGVGARSDGDPLRYLLWLTAIQGALFFGGAALHGGRPLLREVWRRRGVGLATGVLSAGGYAVALWAMTQAPIAPVAALRETSVVFAALLGASVLKEPLGRRRVLAALIVAAGVACVRFAA